MRLSDLDGIRDSLNISAFGRVRIIIGKGDNDDIVLNMECTSCDDLLVRDGGLWVCSLCGQEITDRELSDFLRVCYEWLGSVLGSASEDVKHEEVKIGLEDVKRWVRSLMGI